MSSVQGIFECPVDSEEIFSHSWFGNGIGCANWGHFWLNEGWTTYCENLIEMETHGEQARAL